MSLDHAGDARERLREYMQNTDRASAYTIASKKQTFLNSYTLHSIMCLERTFELTYSYPVHNRFGTLPGTYVHRPWMRVRFYDCNKSI